MSSEKYLKRIDKKMDRLLEIAEQFAPTGPLVPAQEPFYSQNSAAAVEPVPPPAPLNFEFVEEAPVEAPSFIKSSKVNNWNKFVKEVLANMKNKGWKNPNTGKNATHKNAMKEASRRRAEVNANYAAKAATRRTKRNKQLTAKAAASASALAGNAATTNAPAATAGNLVNTTAAAALLAGAPRKGVNAPPKIYKQFKAPSVPIVFAPPPNA
jgi:hypothetical protein